MKTLILTSISLLSASFLVPIPLRAQQDDGDKALSIRAVFNRINADTSLHKLVMDEKEWGDGETDGGGSLTGYFQGDTLCRMSLWVGLSYGVVRESYYFSDGALVFVYESEADYPPNASGNALNHARQVWAFEGRYYFDGYQVFKSVVKGKKKMGPDDTHHTAELYHNAHYYYTLLMKKKRAPRLTASH